MGSNMAEAHPVGFQWVMEAKARGARVIHVDPRFTRTSALADQHVTVRAGTDIAFLGGVINYILASNLEFREYVQAYTNASFLVNEQYQDTEDMDGLFSGYDPHAAAYDRSSWSYESVVAESASGARHKEQSSPYQSGSGGPVLEGAAGDLADDPSLEHPRCVFQILKRHFARYTPEMVERICGVPRDLFLKVCRAWTENSGRERTAALVYSVGWTQHSVGPAGGPRHDHDRKRHLLEGRTGDRYRGDRHRTLPHRGFLHAGCLARGEVGDLHQYPTTAAMAGPGGGADRGSAVRAVVLLSPRVAAEGEAGRLGRRAGPPAAGGGTPSTASGRATTSRTSRRPSRRTTGRPRVQKARRHCMATTRSS